MPIPAETQTALDAWLAGHPLRRGRAGLRDEQPSNSNTQSPTRAYCTFRARAKDPRAKDPSRGGRTHVPRGAKWNAGNVVGVDPHKRGLTAAVVDQRSGVLASEHVGYEPHCELPGATGNTRNGTTPKTLICEHGKVPIDAPRDRDGSFEPQIVRKRQRRFVGFDDKILALYSRGLSVRDIRAHLREIYGVEVSLDLISQVTDAVMDDVREWAKRPLEDIYPIVFLDCMVLKIREGGTVQRRALYLALGVTLEGDRDVLGMWFQETEGAKFWMQVLTDLKTRGVRDILICCVDGLTGFPEAIEAIFPKTTVQTCIVHLIRASLKYVPRREREQVARDLKPIYTAKDADQAQAELEAFDEKWGHGSPSSPRPG